MTKEQMKNELAAKNAELEQLKKEKNGTRPLFFGGNFRKKKRPQ